MRVVRGNCTLTSAFLDPTIEGAPPFSAKMQPATYPPARPEPRGKLYNDQPRRTSGEHYERRRERLFPALTLINIRRAVLMGTPIDL